MDDDREFVHAIKEASFWGSGKFLRDLFVSLLISDQMHRQMLLSHSQTHSFNTLQ
jgi:hypothetical protein